MSELGKFCRACQTIPAQGYCKLAACPNASIPGPLTAEERENLNLLYGDCIRRNTMSKAVPIRIALSRLDYLEAEVQRLEDWNRLRAMDIITLGDQVAALRLGGKR